MSDETETSTPRVEIIREENPELSMELTALARKKINEISDYVRFERRKREVDGEDARFSRLIVNCSCLLRESGNQVELETLDTLPFGVPQIKVRGPDHEAVQALVRTAYADWLCHMRIVGERDVALDVSARSTFTAFLL
jgi:hypothetical protein